MQTTSRNSPGHVACHQRARGISLKTRNILQGIPEVKTTLVERCSGHDGSYALRVETHAKAVKISGPTITCMKKARADVHLSDCPMAGRLLAREMNDGSTARHPITLA